MNDIVSDGSFYTLYILIFIELLTLAQFNAVFSASSTSHVRQPAKEWNYGRSHSSTANQSEYLFCFYVLHSLASAMIALHELAQV
jgi:hypothetical protein